MTFLNNFTEELIGTGILIILYIFLRIISSKLVKRFAKTSYTIEHRTNLVIKYIHLLTNIIAFISLIFIWGVKTREIFITLTSVTTVLGVALIANWSILSNITSGIILFFTFPFNIGDVIRIHDKDFPIVGEIEDIGAFYVSLITKEREKVIYPNNLLLYKGISILNTHFEDTEYTD